MQNDLNALAEYLLANSRKWFPTSHARGLEQEILHMTLGIAGEAGEVVELVKKAHRYGELPDTDKLGEELADVLTYVLNLFAVIGVPPYFALMAKQKKCRIRYENRMQGLPERATEND